MGCQKAIAKQIVEQKADYVLSLKGNQGALHEDVVTYFSSHLSPQTEAVSVDGGHGRIETRSIRATNDISWLQARYPEWTGLSSIMAVTAKRESKDKTEEETRYFISSLSDSTPKRLGEIVRAHWAVENNLHWVLDVAFDEDRNRTRKGHSASNLAVIRHIALNLIKNEHRSKVGIKTKRAKA